MLNTLLPPRIRRVALGLVAAGSMAISGAIIAASPAVAADPLAAVCFRTDPNNVTFSVDSPPGVSGPAVLVIKDANGVVLSTQQVILLNGVITLPPVTVPLPAGSNIVTGTLTTASGVFNTANTPCNELPAGSVVGGYQAVTPFRVLDTRKGLGGTRIGAGQSINLQITGTGNGAVPVAGVGAVYLNFVATGGTAPGYLTVFPSGSTQGGVSSLNYLQGPNVANAVISKVGTDGKVTIRNVSAGSVDLVGDVGGYFIGGAFQGLLLPGAYQPVAGTRIADSRRNFGLTKLIGTTSQSLQVTGTAGVPAGISGVPLGARSVVVNLTAVNGSLHSHITAWETGQPTPNASNVNYTGSKPAANLAVVPLSPSGQISVKNGTGATNVDLVVDVVGYFQGGLLPAQTAGLESPLTPARLLDTRTGNGLPLHIAAKVAPLGTVSLQVAGRGAVPNTRLRAVLVTVTTTQEGASGDIIAYPSGTPATTTSVLSFSPITDIANLAIVRVGTDGTIRLTNRSSQPTHLVVDVAGYFVGNTAQLGS